MEKKEQIQGTIRTYKNALKNNPLTQKEKNECIKKIKMLKLMLQEQENKR